MPRRMRKGRTAVVEVERGEHGLTPVYAAALLKMALELRRPDARPLDEVVAHLLEGLAVAPRDFEAYLSRNFSLVQARGAGRAVTASAQASRGGRATP